MFTSKEIYIYWKFKDKIFNLFEAPNQNNCCATVLLLAVHFNLILGMIFGDLYKYVNCALDETIDTGHTTRTDCDTYYRIILLMLFITPCASL